MTSRATIDRLVAESDAIAQSKVISATRLLSAADAGPLLKVTAGSAIDLQVQKDGAGGTGPGSLFVALMYGAGVPTFAAAPGSGVTIRTPSSFTAPVQYGFVTCTWVGPDEWVVA